MKGKKIVFENEVYIVLHDYGNGQLEIRKEKSYSREIKLVNVKDIKIVQA